MDSTTDMLGALLSDPERLKGLMQAASGLFGGAATTPPQEQPLHAEESPSAEAPPIPRMPMQAAFSSSDAYDPSAELLQKAIPVIRTIAQNGQNSIDHNRLNLLRSLKPFVGDTVGVQFDHAIRLVSIARMAQGAMRELGTQTAPNDSL